MIPRKNFLVSFKGSDLLQTIVGLLQVITGRRAILDNRPLGELAQLYGKCSFELPSQSIFRINLEIPWFLPDLQGANPIRYI
jgi:hypothetical protein